MEKSDKIDMKNIDEVRNSLETKSLKVYTYRPGELLPELEGHILEVDLSAYYEMEILQ